MHIATILTGLAILAVASAVGPLGPLGPLGLIAGLGLGAPAGPYFRYGYSVNHAGPGGWGWGGARHDFGRWGGNLGLGRGLLGLPLLGRNWGLGLGRGSCLGSCGLLGGLLRRGWGATSHTFRRDGWGWSG